MMAYKAAVVCVMFDEKYDFESIFFLGISDSYEKTLFLMHADMLRLIEDFEPHKIEVETANDSYDEPITIAHYKHGHAHYYCQFEERPKEEGEEDVSDNILTDYCKRLLGIANNKDVLKEQIRGV